MRVGLLRWAIILLATAIFVPLFLRVGWGRDDDRRGTLIVLRDARVETIVHPWTAAQRDSLSQEITRLQASGSPLEQLKVRWLLKPALETGRVDTTAVHHAVRWSARTSDALGMALGFIGVVLLALALIAPRRRGADDLGTGAV
jgi:hypothetical protein